MMMKMGHEVCPELQVDVEYKQKAQKYSPFGSSGADEESVQASVEDLLKIALAQDRKEARER